MAIAIYKSWVMQVTGLSTAASLQSLMDTASAGKWTAAYNAKVDYVILNPEGTIRYTIDWQTPTATVWLEWSDVTHYEINASLDKIMIINAIKINIQVGFKTGA